MIKELCRESIVKRNCSTSAHGMALTPMARWDWLYLLLGIIAVGVLLMSEGGKTILRGLVGMALVLSGLAVLCLLLFLAYLALTGGIGVVSDYQDEIASIVGIVFGIYALYWIYRERAKVWERTKYHAREAWREQRVGILIGLASILSLVAVIVWAWIVRVYG